MLDTILNTPRNALAIVFALSLATIAGAWGFEIIGGYDPCALCLQQRWAYYAVVPLSLILLLIASPERAGLIRLGLVVCGLAMLANAALGIYHAGIEWQFWEGPQTCAGGSGLSGGLPDLGRTVVPCNKAVWRFAGLSFAGWNVVASLVIAAVAVKAARRV